MSGSSCVPTIFKDLTVFVEVKYEDISDRFCAEKKRINKKQKGKKNGKVKNV